MSEQNFTEELSDFLAAFDDAEYDTIKLSKEFYNSKIFLGLHIGKSIIENFQMSNINQQESNSFVPVCSYENENGYNPNVIPLIIKYNTMGNASFSFKVFPTIDYVWKEEEREQIRRAYKLFYILIGRAYMTNNLLFMLNHDSMTRVYNENGLMEKVLYVARSGNLSSYVCMFVNLMNFKYVNNKFGKDIGNHVIIKFSNKVNEYLAKDEFMARLGGDNFVLIVKKTNKDKIISFISDMNMEINSNGMKVSLTLRSRIGIYDVMPGDGYGHIMNGGSIALSEAKKSLTKLVVNCTPSMIRTAMYEKEKSNSFPNALKNNEFKVYYQPKVDTRDNTIVGVEALVRWDKTGEILQPSDFIGIFENEGSIQNLDYFVLENVCKDINSWKQEGIEVKRVSVNFSKAHLYNSSVSDDIIRIIRQNKVMPEDVEIELTETAGNEGFDVLKDLVAKLKSYKIATSVDDFGTGYSSLMLLKELEVDMIKIDKSFIDCIGNETTGDETESLAGESIVKNMIKMILDLKKQVIAEGVEKRNQIDFLKECGCNLVQGFYYDEPMQAEDLKERLREGKYN